jgi:hypothetical protein
VNNSRLVDKQEDPTLVPRALSQTQDLKANPSKTTEKRLKAMDLVALLIQIVVSTIIIAPTLWLVGRALAGKEKAKFTDSMWIVLLGTVIGAVVGAYVGGLIAALIMFIVWLGLISHFFDCGWIKALAIAIVAVVVFVVIIAVLAIIGLGLLILWL